MIWLDYCLGQALNGIVLMILYSVEDHPTYKATLRSPTGGLNTVNSRYLDFGYLE